MAIPGFNYNQSNSSSKNQSTASGSSATNVWGEQSPFLQSLYNQGAGILGQQQGAGQAAQGQVDQFMPGVQQGFQGMQGIGQTGGPIGQFADPNNSMVNQQIGNLGQQLGDFFNNQLMPGIAGQAVDVGGFGGARQGVAQGAAAGHVAQQFQQGSTDLMANAYGNAQNAAGQQTQAMLGANSALGGMAGDAFNLGMSPYNAAWGPLQQQAGLLGGPAMLSQSQQQSQGTGSTTGKKFEFGIG
jgi:hypothetical protein